MKIFFGLAFLSAVFEFWGGLVIVLIALYLGLMLTLSGLAGVMERLTLFLQNLDRQLHPPTSPPGSSTLSPANDAAGQHQDTGRSAGKS